MYARQNPPSPSYQWEDCFPKKIRSFLGLCILMGLKKLPALEDYWTSSNLLGCPELVYRWPYRKFRAMLSTFHLNDNSKAPLSINASFDRLYKVRPLLDMITVDSR